MRSQKWKTSWYAMAMLFGLIWAGASASAHDKDKGIYPEPGVYGFSTGEDRVRAQGTITIARDLTTTATLYFIFPGVGLQPRIDATIKFVENNPDGTGVMAATFPDGSVHSVLYVISDDGKKFSFTTRDVDGAPPGPFVIAGTARRQEGFGHGTHRLLPGTYAGILRNATTSLIGYTIVRPDGTARATRKVFVGGVGIVSDLNDIVC